MAELQALLDEWIVAVWQNRPHEGLRDPLTPDKALTPNEKYAALVAVAGYVPVAARPRRLHRAAPGDLAGDQLLRDPHRATHLRRRRPEPLPASALRPHRPARALGGPPRPLRHLPDLGAQPPRRGLVAGRLDPPAHRAGPVRGAGLGPRPRAARRPRRQPGAPRPISPRPPRTCSTAPERGPARPAAGDSSRLAAGPARQPRARRVAGRTRATATPKWPRPGPRPARRTPPAEPDRDDQAADAGGTSSRPQWSRCRCSTRRKEAEKWW